MKKPMKKSVISSILAAIAILAGAFFLPNNNDAEKQKPDTTIVESIGIRTTENGSETGKSDSTAETSIETKAASAEQTNAPQTDAVQTAEKQTAGTVAEAVTTEARKTETAATEAQKTGTERKIDEDGWYTSKDDVALYIHTYGKLPGNFISKKAAEKLGWSGGSLEPYAPGKSIGGSRFGNYEGILPEGHNYTECDIDTAGKSSRGAKRIVFSDDGLIYYTDDHYKSFTLLYGKEE